MQIGSIVELWKPETDFGGYCTGDTCQECIFDGGQCFINPMEVQYLHYDSNALSTLQYTLSPAFTGKGEPTLILFKQVLS